MHQLHLPNYRLRFRHGREPIVWGYSYRLDSSSLGKAPSPCSYAGCCEHAGAVASQEQRLKQPGLSSAECVKFTPPDQAGDEGAGPTRTASTTPNLFGRTASGRREGRTDSVHSAFVAAPLTSLAQCWRRPPEDAAVHDPQHSVPVFGGGRRALSLASADAVIRVYLGGAHHEPPDRPSGSEGSIAQGELIPTYSRKQELNQEVQ